MGKYEYEGRNGLQNSGSFDIYQAKDGGIVLLMGLDRTYLTLAQVNELSLDIYGLRDFDKDNFTKYYNKS